MQTKWILLGIIDYQTFLHWNSVTKNKIAQIYIRGVFFFIYSYIVLQSFSSVEFGNK